MLGQIKSAPGNVSLDSMLTEIVKLDRRAAWAAARLFAEIAPKVVTGWRARAFAESPSHLQAHPKPVKVTLLAALAYSPAAGDHRHAGGTADLDGAPDQGPRAEEGTSRRSCGRSRVTGKENILFKIAEAALESPDEPGARGRLPRRGR